ncbi:unnamed protein product [Ilex paraguariensis]|uniref:EXPERA domain-containing protein n=1 Tax=Ilex paraguariensis TaxID=185542 RepID=A0ABC8UWW3_9AQUA
MGAVMKLIDTLLFLYFLVIAVIAPLIDVQNCLPRDLYPDFLVDLHGWYSREFGDYLFSEKPNFFVGLIWLELFFVWPLSFANLYGVVTGKSWFRTTSLIFGVCISTSMVAILAELIGSGRAPDKLLISYYPFLGLAVLAIFRGLLPDSVTTPAIGGEKPALVAKKRA